MITRRATWYAFVGILGFLFFMCIMIMLGLFWKWESVHLKEGCLLQYGLSSVSLSTGVTYNLLPPEIAGKHHLRIPTVALTTSTVYYVDATAGMIMSYHVGDAHPKKLYDLPATETAAVEDNYWLLLSPSEETLFFLLIEQRRYGERSCSPSTSTVIAYDVHTDHVRLMPLSTSLAELQCPAWIDNATLLVLTADAKIARLDILSGKLVPILEQAGYFAVSPNKTFLLVNTEKPYTGFPLSPEFVLYEFPSLNLLKNLSLTMFPYEGFESFSFTDDQHVLFSLRSGPPLVSHETVWLDWHSLKYSKISNDGFNTYLSACPSWGIEAPLRTDQELVQKVKDQLDRSASQIPMRDFILIVPEGNGVINVFGTLQTQEDLATVLGLVQHVSGVKAVISHVKIGNYHWMYEQEIESDLKWGYETYQHYGRESKQRIYQHLNEYLFYKDHLEPQMIKNVEELRDLLKKDIEKEKEKSNT